MLTAGIIGGGPAALMLLKHMIKKLEPASITIFEAGPQLGVGMPYSKRGASHEHVANLSSDELPPFDVTLKDWVKQLPDEKLAEYRIDKNDFHEKEVVARLLLGEFLESRFLAAIEKGRALGFKVDVRLNTRVNHLSDDGKQLIVRIGDEELRFDKVIVSTGHHWPKTKEGKVPGYFDSPYPPHKLAKRFNHTVALRGSSLTAVDAVKTLARSNGRFEEREDELVFVADEESPDFKIEMHSKNGLLPCLRVHMDEPYVKPEKIISAEEIQKNIEENDGFLKLDFLFETAFKAPLKKSDPKFYDEVKHLGLEEFINKMMSYRTQQDAFELFEREYQKSLKSIEEERPAPWKEMLAGLSIAMNYPAKHMSAEDILRLQKHLSPLVAAVIAFIPQSSARELLALHKAGRLTLIADGENGSVDTKFGDIIYKWEDETRIYKTFVDCIGQQPLEEDDFPFADLQKENVTAPARVRFESEKQAQKALEEGKKSVSKVGDDYFLSVPGLNISDNFQLVNKDDVASDRVFLMAVPFMGGLNPDYSGLDFCENAASLIVDYINKGNLSEAEQISNRQIENEPATDSQTDGERRTQPASRRRSQTASSQRSQRAVLGNPQKN